MNLPNDTIVPPLTRRHFALWMTASGLTACGGGETPSPAPAPPPPAPGPASLSLVAGALGGAGSMAGTSTDARLPVAAAGHSFNSQGELWFTGYSGNEPEAGSMVGLVSAQGTLSYFPLALAASTGVFDAQDRYLVAQFRSGESGYVVSFLQDGTTVPLAGRFGTTMPQDGKGSAAQIAYFRSPVLAGDGLVYFLDLAVSDPNAMDTLRTLAPDGTVTSLLPTPQNSLLIVSHSGAIRRFKKESPSNVVEWAELARLPSGEYTWNILPHSWPASVTPVAPVKNDGNRYWGVNATSGTAAHYALDGTRQLEWQLPGRVKTAVAHPVNGNLIVSVSSVNSAYGDALYRLDLVKFLKSVPVLWVGLEDRRGHSDGTGDAARFDFDSGVDVHTDASGPLYLVTAEAAVPGAPASIRTVNRTGQVASLSLKRPPAYRHLAEAYGYFLTYDPATNTVLRSPKSGSYNAWEPWVQSTYFNHYPPVPRSLVPTSGPQVLRTDTTGLLWFATRVVPLSGIEVPSASGISVIGTISATGQVQVVIGDPLLVHSAINYPPLEQRPWYMDVTDIAFEGGASPVSWVLCNRTIATSEGKLVRYVPELVRLEGATRQSFALPSANVTHMSSLHYLQLCVLPSRPGEVFLSSACGVHRWTVTKGLELLAGQNLPTPVGVRLGALPTHLNLVKFISPGPDANSLYVGSENSVLRLGLPG